MHDMLMFTDVLEKGVYIPMAHAGNVPHRVLCFDIEAAQRTRALANILNALAFHFHWRRWTAQGLQRL
jgi:hypothetical protein